MSGMRMEVPPNVCVCMLTGRLPTTAAPGASHAGQLCCCRPLEQSREAQTETGYETGARQATARVQMHVAFCKHMLTREVDAGRRTGDLVLEAAQNRRRNSSKSGSS